MRGERPGPGLLGSQERSRLGPGTPESPLKEMPDSLQFFSSPGAGNTSRTRAWSQPQAAEWPCGACHQTESWTLMSWRAWLHWAASGTASGCIASCAARSKTPPPTLTHNTLATWGELLQLSQQPAGGAPGPCALADSPDGEVQATGKGVAQSSREELF